MSVLAIVDIIFGSWRMLSGTGFFGLVGVIAVNVSCITVAFTARKQGWHDMMAKCLVVRKGATFEQGPPGPPKPKATLPTGSLPTGPFSGRIADVRELG
jgi:hypothetical protein